MPENSLSPSYTEVVLGDFLFVIKCIKYLRIWFVLYTILMVCIFVRNVVKKVYFGLVAVGLLIGAILEWRFFETKKRYQLDFEKIAIKPPVMYNKDLDDKKYPQGEKYLSEHLALAFADYGFDTKIFSYESALMDNNFRAGIDIYLRAWNVEYGNLSKDKISVLIETIPYDFEVVKNMDIVFTGSIKKKKEYIEKGLNAYFVPQFTRLDSFFPAYDEKYKSRILYIANQWDGLEIRKSAKYAINNGIEIDIYGEYWKNVLPEKYWRFVKDSQVVNDKLKYYYSSADIVLNDTRDDMIEAGFISNRIYDVTACKGFIISDYIPEIEEIYGDAIPMYRTEEEFVYLINYYLNHPEERRIKAEKAFEITIKRFSADVVVRSMAEIIRKYSKAKSRGI